MTERMLCPICGEGHVTDHVDQMETEYKGQMGLVASHYQLCDACGSDFAGAAEMRANKRTMLAFKVFIGTVSAAAVFQSPLLATCFLISGAVIDFIVDLTFNDDDHEQN